MFAVSTALASLLSIDQLSTRFLSSPFLWLMNKFSTDYVDVGGVETGVRMVSIYRNPNIFAGCIGLGVLLVLRPGEGAQALTMLLGASLFLDGVMNLLVALLTVKIIRHQQPDVIETDEFEIK